MSQKRAPESMVAVGFTHATPANAAAGDLVSLTGDMTVDTVVGPKIVLGELVTLDKVKGTCVVECRGRKTLDRVTVGALAAGDLVKLAGVVNKVTKATPVTVAADIPLFFAICLKGGADGATVTILEV